MKILNKIKEMFLKYFYDIKYFGFSIAHYNFWGEFANFNLLPTRLKIKVKSKQHQLIEMFLKTKYKDFINKYKKTKANKVDEKKIIWVCWWQGEDNAPEIVKICLKSIRKHCGQYEVILLDKDNYKQFVELPDFIIDKLKNKIITITHFSDILRMALLKKYGGIWVDSTMYICSNVFNEFNKKNLNSNYVINDDTKDFNINRWCGFFIGGKPNKLFNFVYDFLIQYNSDYDRLINYFLIDYAIDIAYNSFEDCRKDINNISLKNNDIFTLSAIFNSKYNENEYERLIDKGFFKFSYKEKYKLTTSDGEETFYNYFIKINKAGE